MIDFITASGSHYRVNPETREVRAARALRVDVVVERLAEVGQRRIPLPLRRRHLPPLEHVDRVQPLRPARVAASTCNLSAASTCNLTRSCTSKVDPECKH